MDASQIKAARVDGNFRRVCAICMPLLCVTLEVYQTQLHFLHAQVTLYFVSGISVVTLRGC